MSKALQLALANAASKPKLVYFGDAVMLHVLWRETFNYLERLQRAVAEGRAVDEASHYGRWLLFSGLIKIFEAYPQDKPHEVDGPKLRKLADDVVYACGQIYKGGKMPINPSEARVDELNSKVDKILSLMAKDVTPLKPTYDLLTEKA
jgi:hypothetical protein